MKKKKNLYVRRIILGAAGILLVVILALCLIYRKAVRAIWCNLISKTLDLEEEDTWTGGSSYLKIPYASASETQYLDLYVPCGEDEVQGGNVQRGDSQEEDTQEEEAGRRSELPKLYVIIHGGGFVYNDSQCRQARLMYRYFRDHGYACASINYRLAQEEPFPGAIEDCKAAIRFLRAHADEYGYDASRIPVFGESAGGYLAAMCAVTDDTEFSDMPFIDEEKYPPVSGKADVLVDYYGVIDHGKEADDWKALGIPKLIGSLANAWLGGSVLEGYEDVQSFWFRKNISEMTPEEKSIVDPYFYIEKNDLTGLDAWIIHGDADITVPYLQSVRLADYLESLPDTGDVNLTLVPGMRHAADMLYSDEILGKLKTWLDEHLL